MYLTLAPCPRFPRNQRPVRASQCRLDVSRVRVPLHGTLNP